MKRKIIIEVESDDPDAPIGQLMNALETLLMWQWDNVNIQWEDPDEN